jgi:hypothetical protein
LFVVILPTLPPSKAGPLKFSFMGGGGTDSLKGENGAPKKSLIFLG